MSASTLQIGRILPLRGPIFTLTATSVSQAGFDGDLDARMLSWGEEILHSHVETEEVPRGAARARCSLGA